MLVFDVLAGILIAVGLSVADLFVRIARPPASVLGQVPGLAGLHDIDDYPEARQIPGLLVFRYDAPLCFANAEDFRTRALDAVDDANEGGTPVEWFLLNAEAIVELDMTSADALRRLIDDLEERNVVFAMARVKQDFRAQLARGGLIGHIDEDRIYPTLPVALEAFEHRGRGAPARPCPSAAGGAAPSSGMRASIDALEVVQLRPHCGVLALLLVEQLLERRHLGRRRAGRAAGRAGAARPGQGTRWR